MKAPGRPQGGSKVGSGFDARREDVFWGAFETTAGWFSHSPLLTGAWNLRWWLRHRWLIAAATSPSTGGPLGTVSQGRLAKLPTVGTGRGEKCLRR